MRDEELRRRIEAVAEHGERVVRPPDPAVLYRRARRRVARLTALGVLVAGALLAGGLFAQAGLPGDDRYPAVTVPPSPPTTAVPPTTAPASTAASTTTGPQAAAARFPVAPPMIGDAETSVPMAQLVTPSGGWALTRTRLAWTGDGARGWRTITPRQIPAGRIRGAFLLDQRTGWVVASAKTRETGSLVRLAVYRTTDAGSTWRRYSLGALDLGKDDAAGGYEGGFGVLAMPSFVDPRNGWVSVLTSRDGGHGWTSAATGLEGRYPAVRGLAFADHRTGWAVAGRGVSVENGCVPPTRRCDADGALLVTTSAGTTWSDAHPHRLSHPLGRNQHPAATATARVRHACTMRTGDNWQMGSTNQLLRSTVRLSKFRTQSAGIPSSVESRTSDGIPRIRFLAGTPVTLLITGITACLVSTRNGRRPMPGSSTHHTSPRFTRGRPR